VYLINNKRAHRTIPWLLHTSSRRGAQSNVGKTSADFKLLWTMQWSTLLKAMVTKAECSKSLPETRNKGNPLDKNNKLSSSWPQTDWRSGQKNRRNWNLCMSTSQFHRRRASHNRSTTMEAGISQVIALHRVINKSLCAWWLQYRKLQAMFKVSPASLQTCIDTPNSVLEDRAQYTNYVITVIETV
jgi:hypothetical protein